MIPRKIHYCWLSKDPFPSDIQRCIDSWHRILSGYEFVLWDYERFPRGKSQWVDEAFDLHRYAFAADYIRAYALYNEGGIYLDSDVEVLKNFEDLLALPYFLGQESTEAGIEAATMGFEPGHPLMKALLEYYNSRPFVRPDGTTEEQPMPFLFRKCIASLFKYNQIKDLSEFDYSPRSINILPVDWFSPKDWRSMRVKATANTYSIHHFAASWKTSDFTIKNIARDKIRRLTINLRNACTRFLLLNRNICLLTNTDLAFSFSNAFGLPHCSPMSMARLSQEDFLKLIDLIPTLEQRQLQFISGKESKYYQKVTTFYPIARIEATDIEIHFEKCVSCEEAQEIWRCGVKNNSKRQPIVLLSSTSRHTIHEALKSIPKSILVIVNGSEGKTHILWKVVRKANTLLFKH